MIGKMIKSLLRIGKDEKIGPIKTADIMKFAFSTRSKLAHQGYSAKGKLFEVDMKSGKTAIYKCTKYEPAWNVDWGWYYLEFRRYKEVTKC